MKKQVGSARFTVCTTHYNVIKQIIPFERKKVLIDSTIASVMLWFGHMYIDLKIYDLESIIKKLKVTNLSNLSDSTKSVLFCDDHNMII